MKRIINIPEVFYEYCKAQEDAIEIQLAVKNSISLDKVLVEIEEERKGYPPSADYYKAISRVLEIINKYSKESEI